MRKLGASIGSAIFLVVAPGGVALLVPWWITRWQLAPPLAGFAPFRALGIVFIAAGLPVLLDSFARFALQGLGTPAPVAPPKHLVVTGLYRRVRNPMYVAVVLLVLGQALFFDSVSLLEYGAFLFVAFHVFVLAYEEPTLREKFGAEYVDFCAHVRRWLPRLRPWTPPQR